MPHLIIGTAGHIDHGKTSLVKALTGIDTDRLKEEKERGITIDIGFAYWQPDITIIDVPGHERFIRNMVAGVQSIDFVMLVIAADDGIMPQTVEHFEILRLLCIPPACIVITKCDLASADRLSGLSAEINTFLKESPFENARKFRVSTVTGEGIDQLRSYLRQLPRSTRTSTSPFRMFIDRSFSVKGYGTVVTGTVLSGAIETGQAAELLPMHKKVRVRGLQQHESSASRLEAGDRAAINIAGVDKSQVKRGDVLATPDWLLEFDSFYVEFFLLSTTKKPLQKSTRVRVLIGTQETFGAVTPLFGALHPGSSDFCRLNFHSPVVYHHGDRFIVREINAASTLGGGTIVCDFRSGAAGQEKTARFLRALSTGTAIEKSSRYVSFFGVASIDVLSSVFGVHRHDMKSSIVRNPRMLNAGNNLVADLSFWNSLAEQAMEALRLFHRDHPHDAGMRMSEMQKVTGLSGPSFTAFIKHLTTFPQMAVQEEVLSLKTHQIQIPDNDRSAALAIESLYENARFSPPLADDVASHVDLSKSSIQRVLRLLVDRGILIRTDERLYFHHSAVAEARRIVIDFIGRNGHIEVVQFKEKLGISRKFALSLLEYFDTVNLTEREENHRILVSPK